jgi:methylase of polypeptide subunit release factors
MTAPALVSFFAALNARLRALGYTREGLQRRLGFTYPDEVSALRRIALLAQESEVSEALSVLVRAFWLEAPVSASSARAALGRELFAQAQRCDLLRPQRGAFLSTLRGEPVGDCIAWADRRFDPLPRPCRSLPQGHPVYPPSSDSLFLAEAMSIPNGARVLDLCTGSGVLALQAAPSAHAVEAVDLCPRAAALARLNAAACDRHNLIVHQGNLYAPLDARTFDAIVANPPFVPSPFRNAPLYHSGGGRGDRVLVRIVRGWKTHLAAAGRALSIGHVGLRRRQTLADVARQWTADFDGRVLIIELDRGTRYELAAAQAAYALRSGLRAYATEVATWCAALRRRGITEVVAFLIAGERTGKQSLEVASAVPRILPIPLHRTAPQILSGWWQTHRVT